MGSVSRGIRAFFWILKALILKLTPFRRLLFFLGIAILLLETTDSNNRTLIGLFLLIFLILLELKDKLFARGELEEGRKVQLSLLPEEIPKVEGWSIWLYSQPAKEVGGDLIDFLQISEKSFGVVLGDVSGKGLGAALLMAKLQATIRALAPEFNSLSTLGSKVNSIFYRDISANSFASLIYAAIESKSGKLKLFNAGHLPPIIKRGKSIEELSKGSLALGLADKSHYEEKEIELSSGDYLIFYSDGITESQNAFAEFYGKERLIKLIEKSEPLEPEILGNKILNSVSLFRNDDPRQDDLSIAILKYNG
ncbi:MAG: PP2C family protein-serine/threonine phosphatase [Bacteroidetes bacterium]|nr:PP2C family protein-serine/threonine phosphatase [Bacteroidota bacterium]